MANVRNGTNCRVHSPASGALELTPENSLADDLLKTFFTAHGAKIIVAVTQPDPFKDGFEQTGGVGWKGLKLALS